MANEDASDKKFCMFVLSPTENMADKIYESFIKSMLTMLVNAERWNKSEHDIIVFQLKEFLAK